MLSFENDYNVGAHPRILERLMQTNFEPQSGYGADRFCESAKTRIREAFSCPNADIFFLTGGTQTNCVVIDALLHSYEGVIAAATGHIALHEAGAVEYTGHKVLELPSHDGKLNAGELRTYLETFYADENHDHMVFPGMVYLSYPTELGTLYSKTELTAISQLCKEYHIPLFADGARLGYGLMSPASDITPAEFAALCDVFYVGGTKVGALCGEAVVFPHGTMPKHFLTTVKQHGALMAKGRLLGVQFDTLFEDGLYFEISRNAIRMAETLKQVFREKKCEIWRETSTNQQFLVLENTEMIRLREHVAFSFWEQYDAAHTVCRFVTSWATTQEQIDILREML
ncbi:MAG: threonine aldolase family protein [Faecousia sp.]